MWQEKRANDEVMNQLLDLRKKTQGYKKHKEGELEERVERVVDSQLQANMVRKRDFQSDVLPYVYRMIHPEVRPINSQLLNNHEKESLRTSIEIMILFDIKLKQAQN